MGGGDMAGDASKPSKAVEDILVEESDEAHSNPAELALDREIVPRFVVIAVQGTRFDFASEETRSQPVDPDGWHMPEGRLRRLLNENLQLQTGDRGKPEIIVREFEWSGANSERERAKASARLKALIRGWRDPAAHIREFGISHEEARKDARCNFVIVAHSHGGNVAIDSLRDIALVGDQPSDKLQGVITVGTPLFARSDSWWEKTLLLWPFGQPVIGLSNRVFFVWLAALCATLALRAAKWEMRPFSIDSFNAHLSDPLHFLFPSHQETFDFFGYNLTASGLVNNFFLLFTLAVLLVFYWRARSGAKRLRRESSVSRAYFSQELRLVHLYDDHDEAITFLSGLGKSKNELADELAKRLDNPLKKLALLAGATLTASFMKTGQGLMVRSLWRTVWTMALSTIFSAVLTFAAWRFELLRSISIFHSSDYLYLTFFIVLWLLAFLSFFIWRDYVRGHYRENISGMIKNMINYVAYGFDYDPDSFHSVIGAEDNGNVNLRRIRHPQNIERALRKSSGDRGVLLDGLESLVNDYIRDPSNPRKFLELAKDRLGAVFSSPTLLHNAYFRSDAYLLFLIKVIGERSGGQLELKPVYSENLSEALREETRTAPDAELVQDMAARPIFDNGEFVWFVDDLKDNR